MITEDAHTVCNRVNIWSCMTRSYHDEMYCSLFHFLIYRGRSKNHDLVDMAVLVLCYSKNSTDHTSSPYSSPVPISCTLESGSHIQSIVTANGFLEPGRYLILPLAFNHYGHVMSNKVSKKNEDKQQGECTSSQQQPSDDGAVPYVVAVFSAQELAYEASDY